MSAVLPSADSATLVPNPPPDGTLVSSDGVSLGPCCDQVVTERVNTHAAPFPEASPEPPINAVLPF
jgi:hypothetical protein